MEEIEKNLLKKLLNHSEGLLSPADLFNGIGEGKSEKIIHKLITEGHIEEVPHTIHERNYTFYRLTEKTHALFYPIHKRMWYFTKGDIRTVIVSSTTALMTTIITLILEKLLKYNENGN